MSTDNKWHGECAISGYAGTSCNCGNKYYKIQWPVQYYSSNVEKINTNIVGDFTKLIVVKSNAKNNPKSILRISGVVIDNEQLTVEEGKWIK